MTYTIDSEDGLAGSRCFNTECGIFAAAQVPDAVRSGAIELQQRREVGRVDETRRLRIDAGDLDLFGHR